MNAFDSLRVERGHDKGAKGFSSKTRFLAMLFAQLSGADSSRSIETAFTSFQGGLNHLDIRGPIPISTLAHANENRSAEFYEAHFFHHRNLYSRRMKLGARGGSDSATP